MKAKFEKIDYKPGRRIEYISGEWVITEHGKIIARDLMLTEEDADRLVAEVKRAISEGRPL